MNILAQTLLGIAAVAVTASSSIVIKNEFWPKRHPIAQAATPRRIDRCERDITEVRSETVDKEITEQQGKAFAVVTAQCDEYGLVDSLTMRSLTSGPVGPYLKAYRANPDVWRGPQ